MTGALAFAGVVLAFGAALWFYRRRELPVRGRTLFALLRGATLALVLLLLWNPALRTDRAEVAAPVMLVDASGSMRARGVDGSVPAERAAALAADFEGVVRETASGLAAAAARAVEGGAASVTVATDLRGGEGVALRALAAEAAVPLLLRDVGGATSNAGISDIDLPDRGRAGAEVEVGVRLHATDREPRVVALLLAGDTVDRTTVTPGEPGTETTVSFEVDVPEDAATRVEVSAVLVGGDALPEDDERRAVLDLEDLGGGIVALSWAADWEYRTLVPLLDEVSGLDARAFLALEDGRWLRASDDPAVVDEEVVRSALSRAEMAVLHAAPLADSGLVALARRVPRRLLLGLPTGAPGLSPPQPGEWYVSADLPVSQIAAELSGIELLGLPPLTRARTADTGSGSPLMLQRAGSGTPVPAFDLRRPEGERVVEARAEGFWRWSLRPGDANELYRRLWSGLAAWLLTPDAATRTAGFGPRTDQALPGEPVEVLAGEDEVLEVVWRGAGDTLRVDTLPSGAGPLATLPGFDRRGVLIWEARTLADAVDAEGGTDVSGRSAAGALVVQPAGVEMRPARDISLPEDVAALASQAVRRAGAGTPLRDAPWVWVLLVLLLSAEWIGRRRSGLR